MIDIFILVLNKKLIKGFKKLKSTLFAIGSDFDSKGSGKYDTHSI